ncbi:hypothetical protein SAMN05661093_10035 [Kibdelosporangium aridum]|uniref:Uncharacterized protein n=1 Tax=Kibdelosporangium aridum TaxID=2030 RepID=A0A1W2FXI1_KIBAR|nr:hypothetical protein SAMN05661093_10035 [Kibdelosporangium aridum]
MSAMTFEIDGNTIHLPEQLPALTPEVCRILLAMLIDLTTVEVLDEEGCHDC